tara:strand:+ start:378 stop:1208 length:831 start_codon:yes stop_codon:yes gene_type:complete
MAKNHNKKRNIGIIYEQIINFVCERLMEDDKKSAELAINIIKKNFKQDTQLFKEYKLFKALSETSNVSETLATSIINEAKKACNHMFDNKKLEEEKSFLIKDLNYTFGKGNIFEGKIKNYRTYATIQTLLNEWRNKNPSFDKVTEYEIKLHESLTSKKELIKENIIPKKVDSLTYKIMNEMFEKKYNSKLNESQREMISLFIKDNEDSLSKKYNATKISCINILENYISDCNNQILNEKYNFVVNNIKDLDCNDMSKENLQRFLTIGKLKEEIIGE